MSKLGIVGATVLSLALAAPAFAAGPRSGPGADAIRGVQAGVNSGVPSASDASYCAQRWAYYDPAAGKYMGDDGEWRTCP
jgi:BA14K-like protein